MHGVTTFVWGDGPDKRVNTYGIVPRVGDCVTIHEGDFDSLPVKHGMVNGVHIRYGNYKTAITAFLDINTGFEYFERNPPDVDQKGKVDAASQAGVHSQSQERDIR